MSKQDRGGIGKLAAGDAGIVSITEFSLAYIKHKEGLSLLSRFSYIMLINIVYFIISDYEYKPAGATLTEK